jgi:hypothetical protein
MSCNTNNMSNSSTGYWRRFQKDNDHNYPVHPMCRIGVTSRLGVEGLTGCNTESLAVDRSRWGVWRVPLPLNVNYLFIIVHLTQINTLFDWLIDIMYNIKMKTSAKINLLDFQERLEVYVPPEFVLWSLIF